MSKAFELDDKLVEAVIDNANELMSSQCVIVIKQKATQSFQTVMTVTHGINREFSKVKKLCIWLGDKKLFDILNKIAIEE